MSTTVELPGGSAELKDQDELTNREVKHLRKAARIAAGVANRLSELGFTDTDPSTWTVIAQLSDTEDDQIDLFQRTCVSIRLKSWTLELEIPKDADAVDDLPRPIYVPLTVAATDINFSDDFSVDGAADPKADGADSEG